MKTVFPQKIEIDLTGTGIIRVYHDIEVEIDGKKVQVKQRKKDNKGKDVEVQPVMEFKAPPELHAVIQTIADSVRDGVPFEYPSTATIKKVVKEIAARVPVDPVVLPDVKEEVKPETVAEAPAAADLYPEEKGGE